MSLYLVHYTSECLKLLEWTCKTLICDMAYIFNSTLSWHSLSKNVSSFLNLIYKLFACMHSSKKQYKYMLLLLHNLPLHLICFSYKNWRIKHVFYSRAIKYCLDSILFQYLWISFSFPIGKFYHFLNSLIEVTSII